MIPGLYTHLAAAALAGLVGWTAQGWKMGEDIATIKQEHSDAVASSAKSALKLTEHYRENTDAAVRKAESRAAQNKRDADGLRDQLDGLRGDLATVPNRIRNATREAVDQYATTANVLFDQCSRRYSEMAGTAQGHAADVETLKEAWPSTPRK